MTAPDQPGNPDPMPAEPRGFGVGRRRLLQGGAAGLLGIGGVALGKSMAADSATDASPAASSFGTDTVAFHGDHQAGVETPAQAFCSFLGLDLRTDDARGNLARLLRLWTDDASRLTSGRGSLGDQEPELAENPARLTVTVALGPAVFDGLLPRVTGSCPKLPSFRTDALESRWGQTDVLLQVCGDDAVALAHARRVLTRTARPFARTAWRQDGFLHARGARPAGTTPRNLLGQVDGTVNPPDFNRSVWIKDGPLRGGTHLALRRITMQLDTWEQVGRSQRERVLGRTLSDGAPLSGGKEHDALDLEARRPDGTYAIPIDAHVRLAHASTPVEQFLRRGYNYDDADGSGLLFAAYQADLDAQFVPVQERLAGSDALNEWTQAIGSATYTVLPGCQPGATLGDTLGLEA